MKRSRNHNDLTEIENKNSRWDIPGNINIQVKFILIHYQLIRWIFQGMGISGVERGS